MPFEYPIIKALIWLANQLLPVTVALSIVTTVIGLCACPFQSAALQHWFVYLSLGTVVLLAVSFWWGVLVRPTPSDRRFRIELGLVPFVLFWFFLLSFSTQSVREASARTQQINNAKQIVLAAHTEWDNEKRLPKDIRNAAGEPILSWRVSILPYVDQAPLFAKFDLAKPWDSPRNRPFIEQAPAIYPSLTFPGAPGDTPWQGFVGPGTAFEPGRDLDLQKDFPDGTSCTILFAEAKDRVPWSKPADMTYGPGIPLPPLGENYLRRGDWPFRCSVCNPGFFACMADGTVRYFKADTSEKVLRGLIERNDGRGQDDLPDQ